MGVVKFVIGCVAEGVGRGVSPVIRLSEVIGQSGGVVVISVVIG